MYTYEELLRLSGLNERAGEKEKFEKRLKSLLKAELKDGEIMRERTSLREDAVSLSRKNEEITKNAKSRDKGFIEIPEAYYEGKN